MIIRAAVLAAFVVLAARGQTADQPDPLPLRRVVLPADRMADELKRYPEGAFVRRPRAEFEAMVKAAARAARMKASPPRLLQARYRASLAADGSLAGTAEWKVTNPGGGAALLPLNGFNLAVRSSRFENREARLVDLPTGPALFVDEAGDQTVTLDWSARVDARPEGGQLELQLPECPVAVLDLDLPAGRAVVAQDGVPVAGPSRAEAADRRTWSVACGGRPALSLAIRNAPGDRPAVLFAAQRVTQKLSPDGVDAAHTFHLTALHKDIEELTLRLDRRARPVDVSAPDLERWEPLPGGRLRVKLARPVRELTLQVRALASLGGTVWESPGMSVEGAVPRGETLELWLHPGLEVASWKPGDFRLTDSAARPGESFRVLTLQGGGVAGGTTGPRRPTLVPRAGGVTFHTAQRSLWRFDADGDDLSTSITYTVVRGEMFHLPVTLPVGWSAEAVDLTPPDLLRGWAVRDQGGTSVLTVDLSRPVGPDLAPTTLMVRLRRPAPGLPTGKDVPFPDVVPLGGRHRDTGLAIDYDPLTHVVSPLCPVEPADVPAEGPWGGRTPDLYYPFRGEPVAGTLRLTARPALLRSRCSVVVRPDGGRGRAEVRLTVEAEEGRASGVEVFLPGPAGPPWRWIVEGGGYRIRQVERLSSVDATVGLAGLAARTPLELLTLRAVAPWGAHWRLTFDRPLSPRRPAVLRADRAIGRDGAVPLPAVAGRFQGVVAMPAGGPSVAEVSGLRETTTGRPGRSFLYGPSAGWLTTRPRGGKALALAEGVLDGVGLASRLTMEGALQHDFTFTARGWTRRTLPIQLPPGAHLLSARLDGRWIDPPGEGLLELPVPSGGTGRYQLKYATTGAVGIWPRLDAPAPELPASAAGVRRLWLLPPGVRPMLDGVVRLLPGSGGPSDPVLRYPTDLLGLGPLSPPRAATPGERQQALADAAAVLSRGAGMTLGLVVRELATGRLRDAHPLIIDAAALAEAGVGAEALLPGELSAPWEGLGLEMVPRPAGVLLTAAGRPWDEAAIEQAVASGRDPSGRYVSALEWLAGGEPLAAPIPEGWSGWEPVAGAGADSSLLVVRSARVSALGLALTALVVVMMLSQRGRPAGIRVRWLIGLLTAFGVALAWLPAGLIDLARWPLLAGLLFGVPLAALGGPVGQRRAPSTARPSRPVAPLATGAVVLLTLAWLVSAGRANPVEDVVFLIDGPTPGVLVSPSLVERLEGMARADGLPRGEAALTEARYEGRLSGPVAEFDATFQLHSFTDEKATVTLPFDGVSLVGDVRLDGARVFPRALSAPRVGYAIGVTGKGRHKLEVRFRVPVTALGDESAGVRQVRCGVPRLVSSRVLFKGPVGASQLHAPSKLGSQVVTADAGGPSLDADLGPTSVVVLRWFQEPRPPRPPRQAYREAYLWDLQPEKCTLTAVLRYTLTDGATDGLTVAVPAELEVQSAVARRPRGSTDAPARLRDWFMQTPGGARQLRLEFPGPVTGEVEVELLLVPRGPLSGPALLPLPRPAGEVAAGDLAYLAYRLTGLDATRATQGLTGILTDRFAGDWPASARPPFERLTAAFTFRRQPGTPPELRMELRPRAEPYDAVQDVRFTVGRRRADLVARVEVTPGGVPLHALEWDVGRGVTLTDVSGPAVGRWTQTGSRLLVWLERRPGPVTVRMAGWAPVTADGPQSARFELPCLRPGGGVARSAVLLGPAPGVTLAARSVTGLKSGGGLIYAATGLSYGGTFAVRLTPPPPVRVVTRGRLNGPVVAFDSRVEYATGVPPEVGAKLRDWVGEARLDVDPKRVTARREAHRRGPEGRERVWRLAVKQGAGVAFNLLATVPAEDSPVPVPDIQPLTPANEQVVVIEPTLAVEWSRGVAPQAPPAGSPDGTRAWRVTGPQWAMRVIPRRPAGRAVAVVTEAKASVPDGKNWLHEVTWWLRLDGPAELTVVPRGPAAVLGVSVDGKPAGQVAVGRAVVSLVGPGVRRLRVRYHRSPGSESLACPDLTPPRLEGATAGPVVWTVAVPTGWAVSGPPPLPAAVARAARDLYRVEALRAGPEAAELLRSAELALETHPDDDLRGPDGLTLARWLARLREEVGPQQETTTSPVEDRDGSPSRWLTAGAVPEVWLASDAGRWPQRALRATSQWVGVWLVVWLASLSPALRAAGRGLWPELVVLVGAAGWWLTGPTVAVGALLVGGVVSRGWILWRAVSRRLTPRR